MIEERLVRIIILIIIFVIVAIAFLILPFIYLFETDATPTLAATPTSILTPTNQPSVFYGVGLNGVLLAPAPAQPFIFENPNTGEYNWDWVFEPTNNQGSGAQWVGLDCASAHTGGQGYHYHGNMFEYAEQLQSGVSTGNTPPSGPVQIGWAADGFPILYRFGPDGTGGLELLKPSYQLKAGDRPGDGINAPCGPYNGKYTNDYEYVNGLGDLDECNGIQRSVTLNTVCGERTFDYFYVVTDSFPQIGRCLWGTHDPSFANVNAVQQTCQASLVSQDILLPNGDSFVVGSSTYTSVGIYQDILLNAQGCDSVIVTKITIDNSVIDMDQDGFDDTVDCDDNNPNIYPTNTEIPYNGLDDDCNPATLDDDLDQDGFDNANDCDDNNASINPNTSEVPYNGIDDDCNPATLDDDLDQDGFDNANDCNDNNAEVNPNASETVYNGLDDDCDPATLDDDLDQDGFDNANDCDDNNASINPNTSEVPYNGIDDDCNPATLDDDLDQDGFVNANDCDDNNAAVNPNATEIVYNGLDDDCNPATPDGDLDQDGYDNVDDCDDNNPNIYPGNTEIVYNGIDDDCDPATLDDDLDQDGFDNANDCDDNNAAINPNTTEIPYNGIDDDCNPATLDDDLDQDGFDNANDCDDNNAAVNPNAGETAYNGIDDDCNPATLDDDLDQDGFMGANDCDDNNAAINPSNTEIIYNGIDDDCDPATLDDDLDQDGFANATDCDDNNPAINPAATEIPANGIDENCDGADGISTIRVFVKVYLEGAYESNGMMSNILIGKNLLPNSQPFNTAPWNYSGTQIAINIPNTITDWVLLEIRDANNTATIVEQVTAFVANDGQLIGLDGAAGVPFYSLTTNQDYILILRARNHLAIASANSITFPRTNPYDFTQVNNVQGTTDQLKDTGDGHYAMIAGDFNGDGTLTVSDFNIYFGQSSAVNQYYLGDLNLDGNVTVKDFNFYQPNASKIGVSIVRY